MQAVVTDFEWRMALDSVHNELRLHSRLHEWFANGEADTDLDALNERVYSELFLTPSEDEWLGLVPPNAYSALDGRGLRARGD